MQASQAVTAVESAEAPPMPSCRLTRVLVGGYVFETHDVLGPADLGGAVYAEKGTGRVTRARQPGRRYIGRIADFGERVDSIFRSPPPPHTDVYMEIPPPPPPVGQQPDHYELGRADMRAEVVEVLRRRAEVYLAHESAAAKGVGLELSKVADSIEKGTAE